MLYDNCKVKGLKLGFHYHFTFFRKDNAVFIPGQIGVFIEALAANCDVLYLFLEEAREIGIDHDFKITRSNIELISIGYKSSFYKRLFWPGEKISIIELHAHHLDLLLLRAPSPLVPLLFRRLYKKIPVYLLLVGNYRNGIRGLKQPFFRKFAIILVLYIYNILQLWVIRNTSIMVNSKALYNTYANHAKNAVLVKTTTLDSSSFYYRSDTCQGDEIHIIYSGRINFQKGLKELVYAVSHLKDKHKIIVDIIGWEDPGAFSFVNALTLLASELGIEDRVIFHGKKRVGEELNECYRKADIFVLPSYHEGFPRTIWEAMANSVPIICTPVGGIPHELTNGVDVFFVQVKDIDSLTRAINELIMNGDLRRNMIKNAFEKSKQNTVEIQTQYMVSEMIKMNTK